MTLYVSDLDGTLLLPSGELSARARRTVARLLATGVPFTVATARSVQSMREVLGDLPFALPVISFNGGFVSDYATGRHLRVFPLPPAAVAGIDALCRAADLEPLVSTTGADGERLYMREVPQNEGVGLYLKGRQAARDPRLRLVPDPRRGLEETVMCLTLIARRAVLEPLEAALTAELGEAIETHLFDDFYTAGWTWITIHPARARKDRAVAEVMAGWASGGRPSRWVAFGDQHNDVAMLAAADHGVAVANAIPEARAVADEVIGPNADDSVAAYLEAALERA